MRVLGLHHVKITIPRGAEEEGKRFYCRLLGLAEVPKPSALAGRGGFWLDVAGFPLYVGVEDGVDRATTKAHVAYAVDDLAAWRERIKAAGIQISESLPIPGQERFEIRDPFGNRIEIVQAQPSD